MTTVAEDSPGAKVTRLHAVVRGRVQGVGFRYWMHHTVERFRGSVTGRVRNQSDGSVEVVVESADKNLLEAILIELHQGPAAAQVDEVEAIWEGDTAAQHSGPFRVA